MGNRRAADGRVLRRAAPNSEVGKAATTRYEEIKRERGLPPDATPTNTFWRERAVIWSSVEPALRRWTELVLQNVPRVVKPQEDPQVLLECDASKWGWSCYGLHLATNEPFAFSEPWSGEMRRRFGDKLGESTFAEPFGVLNSLERMRERFPEVTRFGVTSDNSVAIISFQRGFTSRSWGINECLRQWQERFPQSRYTLLLRHVAGVDNIADAGSRGRNIDGAAVGDIGAVLRSRWGAIAAADGVAQ